MTTETLTAAIAAAALARKQASRERNAALKTLEQAEVEHRASLAPFLERFRSTEEWREAVTRRERTGPVWLSARHAWFVSIANYCTADVAYQDALFDAAKAAIRAADNAETRKEYGKAIRAKRSAVNREHKAKRSAALAA